MELEEIHQLQAEKARARESSGERLALNLGDESDERLDEKASVAPSVASVAESARALSLRVERRESSKASSEEARRAHGEPLVLSISRNSSEGRAVAREGGEGGHSASRESLSLSLGGEKSEHKTTPLAGAVGLAIRRGIGNSGEGAAVEKSGSRASALELVVSKSVYDPEVLKGSRARRNGGESGGMASPNAEPETTSLEGEQNLASSESPADNGDERVPVSGSQASLDKSASATPFPETSSAEHEALERSHMLVDMPMSLVQGSGASVGAGDEFNSAHSNAAGVAEATAVSAEVVASATVGTNGEAPEMQEGGHSELSQVGRTEEGEPRVDEPSLGEPSVGEAGVPEPSVGEAVASPSPQSQSSVAAKNSGGWTNKLVGKWFKGKKKK